MEMVEREVGSEKVSKEIATSTRNFSDRDGDSKWPMTNPEGI